MDEVTTVPILSKFSSAKKCKFTLPKLTSFDMKNICKKLKSTNSHSHGFITDKIFKQIKYEISPYLSHLIISIIRTHTFSSIYWFLRILPLSKLDKNYQPINNLPGMEIIIEKHIINYFIHFLNNNNVNNQNHHREHKNTLHRQKLYTHYTDNLKTTR